VCLIKVWGKGTRSRPIEWLEVVDAHVLGEYWFTHSKYNLHRQWYKWPLWVVRQMVVEEYKRIGCWICAGYIETTTLSARLFGIWTFEHSRDNN